MAQQQIPQVDQIYVDTLEITNEENAGFGREWQRAVNARDVAAAVKISETALNAEHYLATLKVRKLILGVDPSPAELNTLSELRILAKQARDRSGYGS